MPELNRYRKRKKMSVAIATNNLSLDGSLRRCFKCSKIRPLQKMQRLVKQLWVCRGGCPTIS